MVPDLSTRSAACSSSEIMRHGLVRDGRHVAYRVVIVARPSARGNPTGSNCFTQRSRDDATSGRPGASVSFPCPVRGTFSRSGCLGITTSPTQRNSPVGSRWEVLERRSVLLVRTHLNPKYSALLLEREECILSTAYTRDVEAVYDPIQLRRR